ncbi:hypothetical protein DFS34DRAFT_505252 [Phlyctochytrium arcticum]|nr:hypothetical protein DFS34DRAFT_505252 [Phlyctochytrium arcticum]
MPSITKQVWGLLLGNVGSNSHPIHPALVHIPAALYPIAFGSDLLGLLYDSWPSLSNLITARGLYALGYYSTLAAIISTIPAAITGFAELCAINDRQDPRAKSMAWLHASLNIFASGIAVFNVLTKSKTIDFAPYNFNIFLSALGLLAVSYGGYVGGSLVYKHGLGVKRMGAGKKTAMAECNPNKDLPRELDIHPIGTKEE